MKKIIASVFLSMTLIMSILTISAHANELKLTELEGITQEEVTEETDDEPVQELFTMPDEESENILLDRNKDRSNWIDLEENRQELPEEILEAMGKNSSDDGLKMGTFTTENRPGNSLITRLSIDANTDGYWSGFYQDVMFAQDQSEIITKSANISIIVNVPQDEQPEYWAKQQIAIRGHVMKCDFFTWRPTVDMSYIYGMDLDNLWYLVQNGH